MRTKSSKRRERSASTSLPSTGMEHVRARSRQQHHHLRTQTEGGLQLIPARTTDGHIVFVHPDHFAFPYSTPPALSPHYACTRPHTHQPLSPYADDLPTRLRFELALETLKDAAATGTAAIILLATSPLKALADALGCGRQSLYENRCPYCRRAERFIREEPLESPTRPRCTCHRRIPSYQAQYLA